METNETRLLIRRLPKCLRVEDKESLLHTFGAVDVAVMSQHGKMRDCVFASFPSREDARIALTKLHQLEVFGSRLVVEWAAQKHVHQDSVEDRWECDRVRSERQQEQDDKDQNEDKVSTVNKPVLAGLEQAGPSSLLASNQLLYSYPPPNQTIIANIANAIACVPDLYIQVLHLMNKMNLPAPFGSPTPTPLLPLGPEVSRNKRKHSSRKEEEEEEEEEESDDDDELKSEKKAKRKRLSFQHVKDLTPAKKTNADLIEQSKKKISIKAPSELPSFDPSETPKEPEAVFTMALSSTVIPAVSEDSNTAKVNETDETEENNTTTIKFISTAEILENKISIEEMRDSTIFKNYSPGETSMRLYIKNLAKQVTEEDIRAIYGSYVNWTVEVERDRFDVRLMQQGRMKGQAFIGLPSEEVALRAVQDTNGYLLHGRPMVVQFARSNKPKEQAKPIT